MWSIIYFICSNWPRLINSKITQYIQFIQFLFSPKKSKKENILSIDASFPLLCLCHRDGGKLPMCHHSVKSVCLYVCSSVRLFVCFDSPMCHQSVKIFSHTQKNSNIFSFVNQIRIEKLSTKIVIYCIRKAQLNLTFSVKRKKSFFSLKSSMFKL